MPTKLDLLISFVDNLDARSTHLLNSIQESNYLITDIYNLNNDISTADMTIDLMGDLSSSNYTYLNEFENLYEKSFLLESNMHLNDVVTSETTLDNLYQEYRFLMNRFTRDEDSVSAKEAKVQVSEESTLSTHFQTPPRLHNSISVSNLKLKPIRCRSRLIPRKKSSRRMLSMSTVNPTDKDDMLLSIADESEIITPVSNSGKRPSHHDLLHTPFPKKMAVPRNETTNTNITQSPLSKIMDTCKEELNNDSNTISTSPDLFGELHSRTKVRSNLLPEIPKIEKFELNNRNIFKPHTSNMNSSSTFHPFRNNDDSDELLRLHRLKHFISYGNGLHSLQVNEGNASQSKPSQQQHNLSIFDKTPTFTSVDIENNNIDQYDIENISVCSGFSNFFADDSKEELDNFESYLRKSRVNLAESFPNLITKTRSHDSIFNEDDSISLPSSATSKQFKFHNPIDNMNLNSLKAATTTIEPIYYQGGDQISHHSNEVNKLKGNSTKLLNDVMSKTDKNETSKSGTPNRIRNSLFNFNLQSPSKALKTNPPIDSNPRRGSLDLVSKSLSENFMSLVNNTKIEKSKKYEPPSVPGDHNARTNDVIEQPIPAKETPIVIRNDALAKRLPPRRKDGAHSNLIIGPNKTRILNHGDQSVFRKPLMTEVSRNSLNEALNRSIL